MQGFSFCGGGPDQADCRRRPAAGGLLFAHRPRGGADSGAWTNLAVGPGATHRGAV